jgi:beta-glucanase (GH16 family)
MMYAKAIVILLSMLSIIQGEASGSGEISVPAAIYGREYRLVKNWNFGETIKTEEEMRQEFYTRYVYGGGRLDHLNKEWQRYRDDGNHIIGGDSLKLVARVVNELREGGIESGMIRSKWSGKYGYIECRVKVPRGRGFWPACWLNPQDQKWPPEIDIVELVNNGVDGTNSSFHFVHEGKNQENPRIIYSSLNNRKAYKPGFDYSGAFHTFAVEWTQDRVKHFVDDRLVIDREFQWRHSDGSDGGDAHVLANLAVGGKWPAPPKSLDDFPAAMEIDFIRVWQLDSGVKHSLNSASSGTLKE